MCCVSLAPGPRVPCSRCQPNSGALLSHQLLLGQALAFAFRVCSLGPVGTPACVVSWRHHLAAHRSQVQRRIPTVTGSNSLIGGYSWIALSLVGISSAVVAHTAPCTQAGALASRGIAMMCACDTGSVVVWMASREVSLLKELPTYAYMLTNSSLARSGCISYSCTDDRLTVAIVGCSSICLLYTCTRGSLPSPTRQWMSIQPYSPFHLPSHPMQAHL